MRLLSRMGFILCLIVLLFGSAKAQTQRSPIIPLGPANDSPWLPDLHNPGQRVALPTERRIDVLLLGDGYTSRTRFESDVRRWYTDFSAVTPWKQTTGIFRVRGYWTPSAAYATPAKQSYYQLQSSRAGVGDVYASETRRKIWETIDKAQPNLTLTRDNFLKNTVVVMLVRTTNFDKPSGKCRTIVAPDGKRRVRVAFGNYTHHEFGHAISRLGDEYIGSPNTISPAKQPKRISLFGVSNIAHTQDASHLPWAHLAPGSATNPDKSSVIGLLWIGGGSEFNAYHSEPFCMMNGGSKNWNRDKTARTGWWRSTERFCFWCEEIIVARLWQRAGLLGSEDDGYLLWKQWETQWRSDYQRAFDVPARLIKRNALYAKNHLADSKLYEIPRSSTSVDSKEDDNFGREAPDREDTTDPLEDSPNPPIKPLNPH